MRQRTGRFGGLQVTAYNGLHNVAFSVTCSGTLCSLAKPLRILVAHDRSSCAERGAVPPRSLPVRGNCPCHGGVVAIEALTGAGAVWIDTRGIGRSLVVVRVAADILFRLFQVATVVCAVECRVAGSCTHNLRSMGVVAVEALDVVRSLRSSCYCNGPVIAGGTAPAPLVVLRIPMGGKCLGQSILLVRIRVSR